MMQGEPQFLQSPAVPPDAKTDLNQFCQRYCRRPVTKKDVVYVVHKFGAQFQSIVKLNCFSGQEYAGHLCTSSKEAEQSAAQQALLGFKPTIEQLQAQEETQPKSKGKKQSGQQDGVDQKLSESENPAITPKTKLNSLCMRLAKRYLQKGETVYETMKVIGGHQATVRLMALPGDWANRCWAGEACSTKQKAEQSAADIALKQLLADPELSEMANQTRGGGRGEDVPGRTYKTNFGGWVWQGTSDEAREPVSEEPVLGEVLEWKETHGWIKLSSEIDHPMAGLRRGKIYVGKKDLAGLESLVPGSKVQFILYQDGAGLGAEQLRCL